MWVRQEQDERLSHLTNKNVFATKLWKWKEMREKEKQQNLKALVKLYATQIFMMQSRASPETSRTVNLAI